MKGANNIMKKILLKLNIAIVFIIVLFASDSFAVMIPDVWVWTGSLDFLSPGFSYLTTETNKDKNITTYCFKVTKTGTYEIVFADIECGGIYYKDDSNNINEVFPYAYEKKGDKSTAKRDCYVLYSDKIYYMDFSTDSIFLDVIEFYNLVNWTAPDINPFTYIYLHEGTETTEFGREDSWDIESIFSRFILSISKLINYITSFTAGNVVTMDSIVFNEYPDARLEFFNTNIRGENVTPQSDLVKDLKEPISIMYNIFKNLAIIGYLIILIYIGIRIMLDSTSAKKKATYKETFFTWVAGIFILFFMPYYMKYVIALNDAFVYYLSHSANVMTDAAKRAKPAEIKQSEIDKGFVKADFDNAIDTTSATDYMSTIYRIAEEKNRLGFALAYLILSWQVVMMIVYYYKRAFTIAILIIIFPLVAFTFVWDKLNDGASQGLSEWIKEYTIDVFVQSFHAIVFVFVCNTIYSTLLNGSADFILLMIASSFVFNGEEILKQIFGGGGQSLGSVKQTGMQVAVMAALGTRLATKTIRNVAGKDGIVRSGIRAGQGLRRDRLLLKKNDDGTTNFDLLATNTASQARVNALLPANGNVTPNIKRTAEMIEVLNNVDKKKPEEVAEALKSYHALEEARRGKGPNKMTNEEMKLYDEMMRKCGIDRKQLKDLESAMLTATAAYVALGSNPTVEQVRQISKKLQLEIEAIFPGGKDNNGNTLRGRNNVVAYRFFEASLRNAQESGISENRSTESIEEHYEQTYQDLKSASNNLRFASGKDVKELRNAGERRKQRANTIYKQFVRETPDMSLSERAEARNMAYNIATVEQAFSSDKRDAVTSNQVVNALNGIEGREALANSMMRLSTLNGNVDNYKYIISKNLATDSSGASSTIKPLTEIKFNEVIRKRSKSIVEEYMKDNPDADKNKIEKIAMQASVMELLDTGLVEVDRNAIMERASSIADEYIKNNPSADRKEVEQFAIQVSVMENLGTGLVNKNNIVESYNELKNNWTGDRELTRAVIKLSNIEGDIARLQAILNNMPNDVKSWAKMTSQNMEEKATNNTRLISDRLQFSSGSNVNEIQASGNRRRERADRIFEQYMKEMPSATRAEQEEIRVMANNIATIEQALSKDKKDAVTSNQVVTALNNITKHKELASEMAKVSNLDGNIDEYTYVISKKLDSDIKRGRVTSVKSMTGDGALSGDKTKFEKAINDRANAIVDEYKAQASIITPDDVRKVEEIAKHVSVMELMDTGLVDKGRLDASYTALKGSDASLTRIVMDLPNVKTDITRIESLIGDMPDVKSWTTNTVKTMEGIDTGKGFKFGDITDDKDPDPYISILNIIEAAQNGSIDGRINDIGEFIRYADPETNNNQDMLDRKMNYVRGMNQQELLMSSAFADAALKVEGLEKRESRDFVSSDANIAGRAWQAVKNKTSNVSEDVKRRLHSNTNEYEQPTFNGYTLDEILDRSYDEGIDIGRKAIGLVSDIALTTGGLVTGAAIGAGLSTDGMPLQESVQTGLTLSNILSSGSEKVLSTVTFEDKRNEKRSALEDRVKKRLNAENKARQASEGNGNAGNDVTLSLAGANANVHIEEDGTLSASIHIMAENAEYLSVTEEGGFRWVPYQENYYYTFSNNDPKVEHTLYVYVRDNSGNYKGVRITGIKM